VRLSSHLCRDWAIENGTDEYAIEKNGHLITTIHHIRYCDQYNNRRKAERVQALLRRVRELKAPRHVRNRDDHQLGPGIVIFSNLDRNGKIIAAEDPGLFNPALGGIRCVAD
jgi:hypothetical protein